MLAVALRFLDAYWKADLRQPLPPRPPTGQIEVTDYRKIKDGDFDLLDAWNTIEVLWQATAPSTSSMEGPSTRFPSSNNPTQPTQGDSYRSRGENRIEIEYAEIWFRRVEVKSLA